MNNLIDFGLLSSRFKILNQDQGADQKTKLVLYRLLICYLDGLCGFGCQIHGITHCLLMAIASNRTVILRWPKGKETQHIVENFPESFLPISSCNYNKDVSIDFMLLKIFLSS